MIMKKKQTLTIQEYELPIVISEEAGGGYVARCPVWTDCYAQGDTLEEAINELSYVAGSLIELYKEESLEIPLRVKKTLKKHLGDLRINFPLLVSSS